MGDGRQRRGLLHPGPPPLLRHLRRLRLEEDIPPLLRVSSPVWHFLWIGGGNCRASSSSFLFTNLTVEKA